MRAKRYIYTACGAGAVTAAAVCTAQAQTATDPQKPGQTQPSPQGRTGPLDTGAGGASPASPQGDTPPDMQVTSPGAAAPFAALAIPVVPLDHFRRTAAPRDRDAHAPDRIAVLVRLGSRDAGDRRGEIGGGTAQRALRHSTRDVGTHRALLAQQRRAHVERRYFLLFAVGDEAAVEICARAGRVGEFQGKQPGRARFRDDQLEAFGFEKSEKIVGEFFDIPHGNTPDAERARRPAFALRHLLRRDWRRYSFAQSHLRMWRTIISPPRRSRMVTSRQPS